MRFDRAEFDAKVEDARYAYGQITQDPEKVRKIIASAVAVVVVLVTLIVWTARLIPDKQPDEAQLFLQANKTTKEWVEDATRRIQRDDRYRNVAITFTKTSIIIQGRVDNGQVLLDLQRSLRQSTPPTAMQWSVTTDSE